MKEQKQEVVKSGEVEQIVAGVMHLLAGKVALLGLDKLITEVVEKVLVATDIPIDKPRKYKRESRATRYSNAQSSISDGKGVFEELRDELQEWRDNLPENLQSGSKADALDEAISNLEQAISSAEEAEGVDVEFPGMFG